MNSTWLELGLGLEWLIAGGFRAPVVHLEVQYGEGGRAGNRQGKTKSIHFS